MNRVRRPQTTDAISLFPFLAVLVCTMGALIVLLIVIATQARKSASAASHIDATALSKAEMAERRDILEWRIEELLKQREKTRADLDDDRLALGQIEDHARQLTSELADLEQRMQGLTAESKSSMDGTLPDVDALRQRAAQVAAERDRLRQAQRNRKPSYSVVPYDGDHGTTRRPLYIECRNDRVILQPEGVELSEEDFQGGLGPSNPLAAALRATREHLVSVDTAYARREPYPLLLVRPQGIAAFYVARAALESWGADFGYELIEDDWELEFPPADPRIAQIQQDAVRQARRRSVALARDAPSRYGGMDDLFGDDSGMGGGELPTHAPGRTGALATGEFGHPSSDVGGIRRGGIGSPFEDGASGPFDSTGPTRTNRSAPGDLAAGAGPSGSTQPSAPQGASQGAGGDAAQPSPQHSPAPSAQPQQSLADARGQNWALPNATRSAVPLTRPIRVECHTDRVVIFPADTSSGAPSVVYMPGSTHDAVDEIVAKIWDEIDRWGTAGRGLYWRPSLRIAVAPGAGGRYQQLSDLLRGSGIQMAASENVAEKGGPPSGRRGR